MKKLQEQFETDFAVWKREYETTMKLRECELAEREKRFNERLQIRR